MSDSKPTRGVGPMRGYGHMDIAALGIPVVMVYCDQHGDVWPFGKFSGEWASSPPMFVPERLKANDDLVAIIDQATQQRVKLDTGVWPPPAECGVYLRYNVRCASCGNGADRARATSETLQPIFEALHGAGLARISVGDLRRRVERRPHKRRLT
jgi:hypothetical protein